MTQASLQKAKNVASAEFFAQQISTKKRTDISKFAIKQGKRLWNGSYHIIRESKAAFIFHIYQKTALDAISVLQC